MSQRWKEVSSLILTFLIGVLTNTATSALPAAWQPYLWLSWVPLGICIVVVVVLQFSSGPDATISKTVATPRSTMLNRVERFWVKGVLEQSLYQCVRIELGLHYNADAVVHPWDTIVQCPHWPDRAVPRGTPVLKVFDELGGNMLILGAPGAGKTTLLLELTRDLIARARQDQEHPIPVVFNLSTWAVRRQPLKEWLVEELTLRYEVPRTLAKQWVSTNTLLPLLDGLDEVAPAYRDRCVAAINTYRQEQGSIGLVVCSRAEEYEALEERLQLGGAVVIQSLNEHQIDYYLRRLGDSAAAMRASLRDDPELVKLLDTPLMLAITVLAFKDGVPAALQKQGTVEERRKELFDTYIEAMFERRRQETTYGRQQTIRWLSWLASRMVGHNQTVFYLEWMQPDWLPKWGKFWQKIKFGLLSGLLVGLVVGMVVSFYCLFWMVIGLITPITESFIPSKMYELSWSVILFMWVIYGQIYGLSIGLVAGLGSMLSNRPNLIRPVMTVRWSWLSVGGGWYSSLMFAMICSLALAAVFSAFAVSTPDDLPEHFKIHYGLLLCMILWLPAWITGWLISETSGIEISRKTFLNNQLFHRFVLYASVVGMIFGLIFYLTSSNVFVGLANVFLHGTSAGMLSVLIFVLFAKEIRTQTAIGRHLRNASLGALVSGLCLGLVTGFFSWIKHMDIQLIVDYGLISSMVGSVFGWFGVWVMVGRKQTTLKNHPVVQVARKVVFIGGPIMLLYLVSLFVDKKVDLRTLFIFLWVGTIASFFVGIEKTMIDLPLFPNQGIRRSLSGAVRRFIIVNGLTCWMLLIIEILFPQLDFSKLGSTVSDKIISAGMLSGIIFGLAFGGLAVCQHYTLRWLLNRKRLLPLHLIPFLDDCVYRIFLRKVGGGYVFVHRLLMEHFAHLNSDYPPAEQAKMQ